MDNLFCDGDKVAKFVHGWELLVDNYDIKAALLVEKAPKSVDKCTAACG